MKITHSQLRKLIEQMVREESAAGQQAKQMGLKHMGWGRYGKDGKVTHKSQNGKLVQVGKEKSAEKGKPQATPQVKKPQTEPQGQQKQKFTGFKDLPNAWFGKDTVMEPEVAQKLRKFDDKNVGIKAVGRDSNGDLWVRTAGRISDPAQAEKALHKIMIKAGLGTWLQNSLGASSGGRPGNYRIYSFQPGKEMSKEDQTLQALGGAFKGSEDLPPKAKKQYIKFLAGVPEKLKNEVEKVFPYAEYDKDERNGNIFINGSWKGNFRKGEIEKWVKKHFPNGEVFDDGQPWPEGYYSISTGVKPEKPQAQKQ